MLAIYTILPILKRCLLDGEELCVWGLDTKSQSFSYSDCHLIGELCQEILVAASTNNLKLSLID